MTDPAKIAKAIRAALAEENAIANAARNGVALRGSTIYVPWFPCANCAGDIIQAGISTVVVYPPDDDDPHWGENMRWAKEMLLEAGVTIRFIAGSPPVSARASVANK